MTDTSIEVEGAGSGQSLPQKFTVRQTLMDKTLQTAVEATIWTMPVLRGSGGHRVDPAIANVEAEVIASRSHPCSHDLSGHQPAEPPDSSHTTMP